MKSIIAVFLVAVGLFSAPQAHAQTGADYSKTCEIHSLIDRNIEQGQANVSMGMIVSPKAVFPSETINGQAGKYSIPVGATVAIFKKSNDYSCIVSSSYTAGWMPNTQIDTKKYIKITNKDLIGEWIMDNATIKISQKYKNILVSGYTVYNYVDGTTSHGDFNGEIEINRNKTIFNEKSDCGIYLIYFEKKLLVTQIDRTCGDININFSGLYDKKH